MSKKLRKYKNRTRVFEERASSIFYKWLAKNINRFNHRPMQLHKDEFRFNGIIKNITLQINFQMPEAVLTFYDEKGEWFDMQVIEYIGNEQYDETKGYYDADRTDGIYDYFPSLEELWITNVFEVALKYCNDNLVPENNLYLLKSVNGNRGLIAAEIPKNGKYEAISYELFET